MFTHFFGGQFFGGDFFGDEEEQVIDPPVTATGGTYAFAYRPKALPRKPRLVEEEEALLLAIL